MTTSITDMFNAPLWTSFLCHLSEGTYETEPEVKLACSLCPTCWLRSAKEFEGWIKLGFEDLLWRLLKVIVVEDEDSLCQYDEDLATDGPSVVRFRLGVKRELDV